MSADPKKLMRRGAWLLALFVATTSVAAVARTPRKTFEVPAAESVELPAYEMLRGAYAPGEKLEYEFGWQGIAAATASLEVEEVEEEGDVKVRIVGRARTLKRIDWVWKMRDRVETVVDPVSGEPDRFLFNQRENRRRVETDLEFRREEGLARGLRTVNGDTVEWIFPITRAYDPISAAFMIRGVDLAVGDEYRVEVLNGKSRYHITMRVTGRETIEVGGKKYPSFVLEPEVAKVKDGRLTGPGEKLKRAWFWISEEHPRQVLRIESEVLWGRVYGELVPARSKLASAE